MKAQILAISAVSAALFTQAALAQTATDPATRHTQMLTQMLGLTSTQQAQVQTILAAEETSVKNNQTQVQTARTALLTAIKNNGDTASASQQLAIARQPDDAARASAAAQIYAVLTPDQQTKVGNGVEMLAGMGGGRGPGGPGGPNGVMRRGGGGRQ